MNKPIKATLQDSTVSSRSVSKEEILARGRAAKSKLGERVLVLAHHYQNDDTYSLCDIAGDSLFLAQQAAKSTAEFIVFCGVHFMAESSDILTGENQITILPEPEAGCPMAEMAEEEAVSDCLKRLTDVCGEDSFIPVTYINSAATIKALCGRNGGTVCTSSNSDRILKWALDRGKRVLFVPDQHLGRNTANTLGISKSEIKLWKRSSDDGGLSSDDIRQSKVILWDGYCPVHCRFDASVLETFKRENPQVKIIVHPECPEEIVSLSDASGSTDKIIQTVRTSDPSIVWKVGTERNLVSRLSKDHEQSGGSRVEHINEEVCVCDSMNITQPEKVVSILEGLLHERVVNRITVPDEVKKDAKVALDRMLQLS